MMVRSACCLTSARIISGPWLCKNSTRYDRTRNFGLYGHAESKKTQKFVFRSALRPNQISFSHGQDPMRLRKIWHDEGDHVLSSDAELSKHICRLGDPSQPFPVRPTPGSLIIRR